MLYNKISLSLNLSHEEPSATFILVESEAQEISYSIKARKIKAKMIKTNFLRTLKINQKLATKWEEFTQGKQLYFKKNSKSSSVLTSVTISLFQLHGRLGNQQLHDQLWKTAASNNQEQNKYVRTHYISWALYWRCLPRQLDKEKDMKDIQIRKEVSKATSIYRCNYLVSRKSYKIYIQLEQPD